MTGASGGMASRSRNGSNRRLATRPPFLSRLCAHTEPRRSPNRNLPLCMGVTGHLPPVKPKLLPSGRGLAAMRSHPKPSAIPRSRLPNREDGFQSHHGRSSAPRRPRLVGKEMRMNTTLNSFSDGLRLTVLVTLLALVCAFVTACHSHAAVKASPNAETSAPTVPATPFAGTEPAQPLDERLITPMETVGASARD